MGIESIVNEFTIEKKIEDSIGKTSIDSLLNFENESAKELQNNTFFGRSNENAEMIFICDENEVKIDSYILHNEGKINHRLCQFQKKVYIKNNVECIHGQNGNIFDHTASTVSTLEGDLEKYTDSNSVIYIASVDEEISISKILQLTGGIPPPNEGYFIEYATTQMELVKGIDPDPTIGEFYDHTIITITGFYARITSPTQISSKWLPLSTGGFYFANEKTSEWVLEFTNNDLIGGGIYYTSTWNYGRANSFIQREISNTINFNQVIEDIFKCSGKLLVSNFFGINQDGTEPGNGAYEFATENLRELKIVQSYDIIREDANTDSFGKSGKYEKKKLLKDICTYFSLVVINDDDKLRLEHTSYFKVKGLNLVAQNIAHNVDDILEVNKEFTKTETWRMSVFTPASYTSKIVYLNNDLLGNDEEYPINYLLSDFSNLLNNKEYEKKEYYDKFFLLSTSNNKVIKFNSELELNNIIKELHYEDRKGKLGYHDDKLVEFTGYSLGIESTLIFTSGIKTFLKLQPLMSVVTNIGTFLADTVSFSENDKITIKIKK